MKNATTRALYAYWDRLRAGRAAPDRSDLDPGAIRTLLGDVFLLEMDGQARTRVRLAGTRICTLLGHEWKGHPFDGPFPAGDRREIQSLLDGVCAAAIPVVAGVVGETPDGRQLDLEMLILPLRHRGKTHARLLGSLSWAACVCCPAAGPRPHPTVKQPLRAVNSVPAIVRPGRRKRLVEMADARQAAVLPLAQERRRHQRVKVMLTGRFMRENRQEYPCQTVNMSPGGVLLQSEMPPHVGEHIVAYIDHLGRVEGRCTRVNGNQFSITVSATLRRRDKLADQLTWFANRNILGLPEDRRHKRFELRNPRTTLTLPDGSTIECRVVDVSLSGAAVATKFKLPLGSPVHLGRTPARVVRHLDTGIALEFTRLQNPDTLEHNLGGDL